MPSNWGTLLTFPQLAKLNVAFNPDLEGTLPEDWGEDGSSMQALSNLDMNNCHLAGSLPAQWARALPSLQRINASSNGLTGTMSSFPETRYYPNTLGPRHFRGI